MDSFEGDEVLIHFVKENQIVGDLGLITQSLAPLGVVERSIIMKYTHGVKYG